MKVTDFADIQVEFIQRAHSMVWCNVATIDAHNRPRSRVLHPIWEGATGWIYTHRHSYKARDLAHNPYVSLAYIADPFHPVYADCRAEWIDDLDEKRRIWDLFKSTPEPLGYDPSLAFTTAEDAASGLLRLTPWRIDLVTFPAASMDEGTKVWRNPEFEQA